MQTHAAHAARARWPIILTGLLIVTVPVIAIAEREPARQAAALSADTVNAATANRGRAAFLRAQVLLERRGYSPGEIDGSAGTNTLRAVRAFQTANKLAPSGRLDAATWAALATDDTPALVTHAVAGDDLKGPFAAVPADMMEKAALPVMGFATALEGLAERFHASPALLRALNPGAVFDQAGTELIVPNVAELVALPKAATIVVDESDKVLQLLGADEAIIAQFPASTGSKRDPLPIGEWKVLAIAQRPVFHYNPDLFWSADPMHSKAKIAPGPNNPVGVVWIDLSKEHYGIHGTPEPGAIGKTESNGCIRLTNWSAARVAAAIGVGTRVVLRP